jgi:hypothetical protein
MNAELADTLKNPRYFFCGFRGFCVVRDLFTRSADAVTNAFALRPSLFKGRPASDRDSDREYF